jgi:hypothetical protein
MTTHNVPYEDTSIADEEVESSALEYARFVGFCRDYILDDPFDACFSSPLPLVTEHDWDDPPGAPPMVDASFDEQFKERLKAPIEAAAILQKVMFPDESISPLDELPDVVPRKSLKIQLPLLRTDHDADVRIFCTRTPEVALHELKLPLEHIDIENDEGMEWPARYENLPAKTMKQINEERLEIPKDGIKFLQSVILPKDENVNHDHLYDEIEEYVKVSRCYGKCGIIANKLSAKVKSHHAAVNTYTKPSRGSIRSFFGHRSIAATLRQYRFSSRRA